MKLYITLKNKTFFKGNINVNPQIFFKFNYLTRWHEKYKGGSIYMLPITLQF